jgi:hypothetical protein
MTRPSHRRFAIRRPRNVLVLAAVLLWWLALSATHLHVGGDEVGPETSSTTCAVCLSLPSAAGPPTAHAVAIPITWSASAVALASAQPVLQDVPSSYRSRAPPL